MNDVFFNDKLRSVEEKITENGRPTMTSLSVHFPEISHSHFHEIVSEKLNYQKLCAPWVPKKLTEQHKMKRWGSALAV